MSGHSLPVSDSSSAFSSRPPAYSRLPQSSEAEMLRELDQLTARLDRFETRLTTELQAVIALLEQDVRAEHDRLMKTSATSAVSGSSYTSAMEAPIATSESMEDFDWHLYKCGK